jgi:sulfatase modifying factor 1
MRVTHFSASPRPVLLAFLAATFAGCFHSVSPNVDRIICQADNNCPSGYVCAIKGQPGGCRKTFGGTDANVTDSSGQLDGMVMVFDGVTMSDGKVDDAGPSTADATDTPDAPAAQPDGTGLMGSETGLDVAFSPEATGPGGNVGATGGVLSSGGVIASGGIPTGTGGAAGSGGASARGGSATGGTAPGTGGILGGTGGIFPAGGSSSTGGIPGTGGASTAPCANTSATVGTVGACCVENGAYGCSGNASVHKALCSNGTWIANGDCSPGQYCDTRPGGTAGSCQSIVVECAGKHPGDTVCRGQTIASCGPDLVTTTVVKTCDSTTPVCLNGACVACSPDDKRCDVAGTNGVQNCGSNGAWMAPVACGGTKPRCNSGTCVACPGNGGPSMVGLPLNYCIDSTEVTQAQYKAWLDTSPSTSGQVAGCAWNTDFAPATSGGCDWPPTAAALNDPVACVDWCDAYAYCAAVGKRLCGKISGGAVGFNDYANASMNQWYAACTSNGTYPSSGYPYGSAYQATYCNGADTSSAPIAVGHLSSCQSSVAGYSNVFDLSGNVAEWVDSCDGVSGPTDHCRDPGGAWTSASDLLQCGNVKSAEYRANAVWDIGFRCCSP